MTMSLLWFLTIVAVLLGVLVWALSKPKHSPLRVSEAGSLEQLGRRHATYLALIRHVLSPTDFKFLTEHASDQLAVRVRKERREVVLSYLASLREDHLRLLRLGRAIAALSPEVASEQELERMWLTLQFALRYRVLRWEVRTGLLPL